jgi:hypothetical protein
VDSPEVPDGSDEAHALRNAIPRVATVAWNIERMEIMPEIQQQRSWIEKMKSG